MADKQNYNILGASVNHSMPQFFAVARTIQRKITVNLVQLQKYHNVYRSGTVSWLN